GQTIKVPSLTLKGFKFHNRSGGFNRQDITSIYREFKLRHDRDVEFYVDRMDVDETNQALAAANITNQFEREHAIVETDCYRLSEIYAQFKANGGTVDTTVLTADNILNVFDKMMMNMDELQVPTTGRILYINPVSYRLLKSASGIQRTLDVNNAAGNVDTNITMLDGVKVVLTPSSRMWSKYDFTDGWNFHTDGGQINMILIHPNSVIAVNKHSYIKLWPEGTHTMGDGYLYQNRQFMDIFVIQDKISGVAISATK
ncbi:MAG: capsid protein, partial [Clostridiales bacterium]|nr:capsid protein [Clostridiales bacterium]